jgi:nucleoside-diphosphate-sugar epimerase
MNAQGVKRNSAKTAMPSNGVDSKEYLKLIETVAAWDIGWESLDEKTLLITGASGGIGTFFIDALMCRNRLYNGNVKIIALGRDKARLEKRFGKYSGNRVSMLVHDVNSEIPSDTQCDFIIHAASSTHPLQYSTKPIETITANVMGTYNLLELASRQKKCRMVFLSSVEVYGQNKGDINKFSEEYCGYIDCNTLRAGYPESKRVGEALCQAYIHEKNVDAVILRLCRVYGPTTAEDDSKAVSQLIRNAVNHEDIILKSEGTQLYSYVFIADVISALMCVMRCGKTGEAYNAASDDSDISLKDIAGMLSTISNVKTIYQKPESNESMGYSTATKALLDTAKIKNLGWVSRYNFIDGLKLTTLIKTISQVI